MLDYNNCSTCKWCVKYKPDKLTNCECNCPSVLVHTHRRNTCSFEKPKKNGEYGCNFEPKDNIAMQNKQIYNIFVKGNTKDVELIAPPQSCPYCSGEPNTWVISFNPNSKTIDKWVCGCDTSHGYCEFRGPLRDTIEEAIEAWNKITLSKYCNASQANTSQVVMSNQGRSTCFRCNTKTVKISTGMFTVFDICPVCKI